MTYELNDQIPNSVTAERIGLGAKFVMMKARDRISVVLFNWFWGSLQHIDMARRLFELLKSQGGGENIEFIGAGTLDPFARTIEYGSLTCSNKENYGRDRPGNPAEAEAHLIELRRLLGWS